MKNHIFLILFMLCISSSFGIDNLNLKMDKWGNEIKILMQSNPEKSNIEYKTDQYYLFVKDGIKNISKFMEYYKENTGFIGVLFPPITKVIFLSRFDNTSKCWVFDDYPAYIYYPPGFHPEKKQDKNDSIWIYWWDEGRKLTPEIFKRKYEAYMKAKSDDKEYEIKKAYTLLQNMGIIILPNLLEKIESGEKDLIPMFSYLTDGKVKVNASGEDCKKYWDENKNEYRDLLDFSKIAPKK